VEDMVEITLDTRVGRRNRETGDVVYYGPGKTQVPKALEHLGNRAKRRAVRTEEKLAKRGGAATGRGTTGGNETIDYAAKTVDELKELATARQLEVKRSDGQEGAPLKEDYVAALKRDDRSKRRAST
jgi:hypothetical protein